MTEPPSPVRGSYVASLAQSHPVAGFFTLALALSWTAWVAAFLWGTAATSVAMIPGAFGPALAAVVMVRLRGGSVRRWLADGLDWRVGRTWYAVALGLPLGLGAVVGACFVALTGRFEPTTLTQIVQLYPLVVLFTALLGGGQEEFGWRGYALPALQERFDALAASVVIGVVWAAWHLPAFLFEVPGYTGSFALYGLLVVGVSVVFTWLYNSTGGSVLLAMLLHGGVNAAPNLAVAFVGTPSALGVSPYLVLVPAVWVVALVLLVRYGRETLSAGPDRTDEEWPSDAGVSEVVS